MRVSFCFPCSGLLSADDELAVGPAAAQDIDACRHAAYVYRRGALWQGLLQPTLYVVDVYGCGRRREVQRGGGRVGIDG